MKWQGVWTRCWLHTPHVTFTPLFLHDRQVAKHWPAPLLSHCTGKYFCAGASAGTNAPCQEEQAGLNPAHPIYTAAHFLHLETCSFKHTHKNLFCTSSTYTKFAIFAPSHSRRLIPSACIIKSFALRVAGRKKLTPSGPGTEAVWRVWYT